MSKPAKNAAASEMARLRWSKYSPEERRNIMLRVTLSRYKKRLKKKPS